MDEKINLKAVDLYSEACAAKIAASFFVKKEKISGPEIIGLCEVKQVNLFVIRELLKAWKVESQKLKSPYFDYQAKEVTEALALFQNTLSNHILISKNDFLPLLVKAISETIYLVLDPYDFYSDILTTSGSAQIHVEELKSDIKYLRINKPPLERLVHKLEEKKLRTISGNEAFALLDSILEEVNFTPEEVELYLPHFSKVHPLDLEKLYDRKEVNPVKPVEAKPTPPKKQEAINAPKSVAKESKTTLADNFQKIASLKDSLTINQKFMFTKMLFNGDFEIFSQAIDRLDTLDNLNQANVYLEKSYPEWDKESEEYEEFIEMVEKRFA